MDQTTTFTKIPMVKLRRLQTIFLDPKNISKTLLDLPHQNLHPHTKETSYNCIECQQYVQRSYPDWGNQIDTSKKMVFKCNFCNETFNLRVKKIQHEISHIGIIIEKEYRQTKASSQEFHCEEHTKDKESKHSHKSLNSQKIQFSTMINKVKVKQGKIHAGEKRYNCDYCEKRFRYLYIKVEHERVHTGERPYNCKYCEKQFSQGNVKVRHERIHTGERPYKCKYCEKRFARKEKKNRHERIHTGVKPYKCMFCKKQFSDKSARDGHLRIHTGEKPFMCKYCNKQLTHGQDKYQHEKIHTGNKVCRPAAIKH